jgi:hypothetical protein
MEVEMSQRQLQIADLKQRLLAQYLGSTASAERVAVLFVPSGDVLCGQLLLQERRWPRDKDDALLVPLLNEAALECDAPFYVTRAQWDECERQAGARVLRLTHYRSPPPLDTAMDVESSSPDVTPPTPPPRLLWLHRMDAPTVHGVSLQYVCALLDFALLRLVPHGRAGTQTKWVRHYEAALISADDALCVAATYVRARALCDDDLLRCWVRMEVALLARTVESLDLDQFHTDLVLHCAATASARAGWQHGQWHQYTAGKDFWLTQPDGTVQVSALWLLEDELAALTVAPRAGLVALTGQQLRRLLVPALYRMVLQDVTHQLAATDDAVAMEDDATSLLLELGALPLQRHGVAQLDAFGRERLHNTASPVLKRVAQYLDQQRRRKEERGEQDQQWRALRLAQHVDLEDLFRQPAQHLPPCLARVVPSSWYKYEDRIQLVTALLDQGFSDRERITNVMCRDKAATQENKRVVARLVADYVKKRQQSEHPEWRLSRRCDTLIDAVYQEGNLARCPYEEAQNGAVRRRDHSDDEKRGFRRQCACELAGGDSAVGASVEIYSPMDYVGQRLARNLKR